MGEALALSFKSGPYKEKVFLESSQLNLAHLVSLAATFIKEKFPDHGCGDRLCDHLLLYRHDPKSLNILQPINNIREVADNSLLEIIISRQLTAGQLAARELTARQLTAGQLTPGQLATGQLTTGNFGATSHSDRVIVRPHALVVHSYRSPAFCDLCGKLLLGIFKQGLQCQVCSLKCHKRCALKAPNNCTGVSGQRKPSISSFFGVFGSGALGEAPYTSTPNQGHQQAGLRTSRSYVQLNQQFNTNTPSITVTPEPQASQLPHRFQLHNYKLPTVCQVCRKLLKGIIRQGYQCKDCGYNCHKKCEPKAPNDCVCSISPTPSLFMDNAEDEPVESGVGSMIGSSSSNVSIFTPSPKQEKKSGEQLSPSLSPGSPVCLSSKLGSESESEVEDEEERMVDNVPLMRVFVGKSPLRVSDKPALKSSGGVDKEVFTDWQEAIQQALMPIREKSMEKTPPTKIGVRRFDHGDVAIKVIEKRDFPKDKEDVLRTEVHILKGLHHPGIVNFEMMVESDRRIFLVMEKMEGGDLLEMIIHTEYRRLNERTAKFITYQVLVALKYLHEKDIAHCDMKPENILLSSDADFPQTYTLWADLRRLEESIDERYLTSPDDDEVWRQYEKIYSIQPGKVNITTL